MPRKLAVVSVYVVALLVAGVVANVSLGGATAPAASSSPTETVSPPITSAPITSAPTAPAPSASPAATATPVSQSPAAYCTVADQLTPFRAYGDYARTYLDWTYALPAQYAPPDLTPAPTAGFSDARNEYVRKILVPDLTALRADASAAGLHLTIVSAYRSYAVQDATFAYWVRVGGYDQALLTSARAGHSEHQLGTAIDFSAAGEAPPWQFTDWGTTPTGRWLADNAWRYGFVLSYPAGKTSVTCYAYEPWHYRWIGRDAAAKLRQSGLTLREYLAG